jgi:hypothetical protein
MILKGLLPVTATLAVLMPLAAQAAGVETCEAYAQAAVSQVSSGHSTPACEKGMDGPRWSAAFRVHFTYCMTHSGEVVDGQRAARNDYLRSCGAEQ